MGERMQTAALIALCLVALSGFLWPMLIAIQHEWQQKKLQNAPSRFDERQKLARQRAGNHAMYVLLGFLVLWAIVHQIGWFDWTGSVLDLVLCALMLAWCVWASECVLRDGLVGWKEKKSMSDSTALLYCVWMTTFVRPFCDHGLTASHMPFVFAVANCLVLCLVLLYKWRRGKREEQEEDVL